MSPVRTVAVLAAIALAGVWVAPRILGPQPPIVVPPPLPDEPDAASDLLRPTRAPPRPLRRADLEHPLDLTLHARPGEALGEHLVVVTVRAPDPSPARAPLDLVVALDTSGSMRRRGRLDQASRAIRALAVALSPEDRLGIVQFSDDASTVRPLGPLPSLADLDAVLETLEATGETDLGAGLTAAGAALSASERARARRIVVISDGAANRGEVSTEGLARIAGGLTDAGVGLWTYGLDAEHDSGALSALAGAGGGTYTFVERPRDLPDVLRGATDGPQRLAASAVRVDFGAHAGVRVVDVPGAGPEVTFDEASVRIGALHVGATRTVVVRLRGFVPEAPTARVTWIAPGADAAEHTLDLDRRSTPAPPPAAVAALDAAAALSRAARAAEQGRWGEAADEARRAVGRLREGPPGGPAHPSADVTARAEAAARALAAPPDDAEGRSVLIHRARAAAWALARSGEEPR